MHTLFHKYPVCTKVAGTLNHFFSFWCVWSIKPGEGFSRVCNKLWFDRPYISLNTSKHSPNGPLWILPSLWSFVCVCVCVYCKQMCNRSCAFSCLYKTELKETACVCLSLRVSTRLLTSQRSWVVIKKKRSGCFSFLLKASLKLLGLQYSTSDTWQGCDQLSAIFRTNPTESVRLKQWHQDFWTTTSQITGNSSPVEYYTVHSWLDMMPAFKLMYTNIYSVHNVKVDNSDSSSEITKN